MRVTFGLASLTIVTGFCLVQACSSDDATPQADADAGDGTSSSTSSSSSSSSSGGSTSSSSSGGSTSSSSGGTDAGGDASKTDGGKSAMTFFVSSKGNANKDGNLGGLTGADKLCQDLATAAGGGDHTWAAYLSTNNVDAKDRIGKGPWQNQKGVVIAKDVAALTAQGFNIKGADVLDEAGKAVPAAEHDILTGTDSDGTANNNTCQNWTSGNNGQARVGHADSDTTNQPAGDTWTSAHNVGCSANAIKNAGGAGRIYCFAKD